MFVRTVQLCHSCRGTDRYWLLYVYTHVIYAYAVLTNERVCVRAFVREDHIEGDKVVVNF